MNLKFALALILLSASAAAAATELTYASPYGPNHPFSLADRTWIHWVEQRSGGRLHIVPIWAGALLSSDQSMLELRHHVADIGLITPIYTRGGAQLIRTQAGFYDGARSFAQQVAMYRCLEASSPEFARELNGLTVLAVQGGTLPGVLTRTRRVTTLDGLRGLRIRAPTELLGVLRELGADPVEMPMGDVYSALAKGVLDGVVAPADTLRSLHFAEVAKHFWQLEVPRGAYPARAMATDRWQRLSADDRAVLTAARSVWEQALDTQTQAAVQSGQAMGRLQGVEFVPATPEQQARFDELYQQDAARNALALRRYDISANETLTLARRITDGIRRTGSVSCGANP
ncbi:MAG TPA: TRAP transporter substrate-binding protein DctP [Steroidobacteraceae bacterium]|jgi:TRAP-type C4-dicarboxylate transport system substrate-binding protein|nr:TRAP transporter substrate-binding protein DctP [Steroidobacteraceae bacterium]